jgi:hypothetical protein
MNKERSESEEKRRLYMKIYNKREYVVEKKKVYSKEWEKKRRRKPRTGATYPRLSNKNPSKRDPLFNLILKSIGVDDLYVYFIQVKGTIIYKVGVTNNPLKRVEVLQTGCPFDIELKMAFVTVNASDVERRIHNELLQFRRRGEWFNITDDHLERIKYELQ